MLMFFTEFELYQDIQVILSVKVLYNFIDLRWDYIAFFKEKLLEGRH